MAKGKMPRDIIVMIGVDFSGKTQYVDSELINGPHQIISFDHIREAFKTTKMSNPDIVYASMDLIARSHMIKGIPIIIDEANLTIESLFLWKTIAREFNYTLKGIVMNTTLEDCKARLEKAADGAISDSILDKLNAEYKVFEELKIILKMKHQQILDKVTFVTYNGGSNHEIL